MTTGLENLDQLERWSKPVATILNNLEAPEWQKLDQS